MLILVYGQGHQGFLMIEVDENTLKAEIIKYDLGHSFAQYIDNDDKNIYVLEQSEGNRSTDITKFDKNNLKSYTRISVLPYGGKRTSSRAVSCYASVDGIELSNNNVLSVGTSIDQSKYNNAGASSLPHNIYLTVTPKNNFSESSTKVKWITNYSTKSKSFTGLEITKINDNKFMISWEEFDESLEMIDNDTLSIFKLHYVFVDGNGNQIGKSYTANASISDCRPIVKGNKVVYYASNENMVDFYTIDSNTTKLSKVMYRVVGDNAIWNLSKDGTLTISGSGNITASIEGTGKGPLSTTSTFFQTTGGNSWNPIKNMVKKIVVESGITSIPDEGFCGFSNLTDVSLPNTIKTIGKEAFAYCYYLRCVSVPSSVTSIGDDAFWSGYYSTYDGSKINYARIYTTKNSYAESWAKNNKVTSKLLGDVNDDGKINSKDASLVLRNYVGTEKLDDYKMFAANVNNDGKINSKDASLILKYYVGTIKTF